jgi:penicillin-insensitive murein endopeptidase
MLAGALWAGSGCVGVLGADGSLSAGDHARGALVGGVLLPTEGPGYYVPEGWKSRGTRFTTERVARWLVAAFGRASALNPDRAVPLGDLSARGGGRLVRHRSHESGRDLDLFFLAVDPAGRPLRNQVAMLRFGPDGRAFAWSPPEARRPVTAPVPEAHFDAGGTWAVVRALLEDRTVEIQWIFVHEALARRMLDAAAAEGAPPALLARAAALFRQPSDSAPHDDHMHVRVYCDPSERALGCVDRGPVRWWKKRWKYVGRTQDGLDEPPVALEAAPPTTASR